MLRMIFVVMLSALLANEAAAEAGLVQLSAETCRSLVAHAPAPDVAFQPGVDGRGQPVAPADLPEERLELQNPITVEIEVDLFRRFGITVEGRSNYKGRAVIGTVEVDTAGGVQFNHRPLPGEIQRRLSVACASKTLR
ncbi:MAG: hypothetical protein EXQ88_02135 [Alphaproteobacteria bacterium]|nr:hypothetical protein [Alphaproteobacteria bacterium]